jgi:hypothetical protein
MQILFGQGYRLLASSTLGPYLLVTGAIGNNESERYFGFRWMACLRPTSLEGERFCAAAIAAVFQQRRSVLLLRALREK